MKPIQHILAIILPEFSEGDIRRFLRNAIRLGEWLNANIHVLAPSYDQKYIQRLMTDLGKDVPIGNGGMVIHSISKPALEQVLETIDRYDCDLVFIEDGGTLEDPEKASLRREILETAPCPVLLIPSAFSFEGHSIQSLLVPLSGEKRASEALRFALALAEQVGTPVDIMHVTAPDQPCMCYQSLESVGDEFQHEYPKLVDKVVSEASPFSTLSQKKYVRDFYHCAGSTVDEITNALHRSPDTALTVEWKGTLLKGRAEVVKNILRDLKYPVLFVKERRQAKSTLKVGPDFEAA